MKDTFHPASADDVCENCSRTRAEHKSSICVTGGFCKFPVTSTKATFDAAKALSDLLARIHRDGGQYESEHGTEKAVADADIIVANLYGERDDEIERLLHVERTPAELYNLAENYGA